MLDSRFQDLYAPSVPRSYSHRKHEKGSTKGYGGLYAGIEPHAVSLGSAPVPKPRRLPEYGEILCKYGKIGVMRCYGGSVISNVK
jgi:hypothetical protein